MSTFLPLHLDAMLANTVKFEKLDRYTGPGYYMQPKLDGWRCLVAGNSTDRARYGIRAWSRTGHDLTMKLPDALLYELSQNLREVCRVANNPYMVLDGELGYEVSHIDYSTFRWPIIDFNMTQRVLGSDPGEAHRKLVENINEEGQHMRFYCFDAVDPISDLRTQEQRDAVRGGANGLQKAHFSHLWGVAWNMDGFDQFVLAGGEGVMLKNRSAIYLPGKRRANTWYKLKKFDTFDAVIMGFTEGQGKYEGQIGAIKVGLYHNGQLREVCQVSGMTDEMRLMLTHEGLGNIGEVLEVKYFGLTAGTPRFPQFLRWRFDKHATDCTIAQLNNRTS